MLRPFAHLLLPCCSLDAPSCSLVLPRCSLGALLCSLTAPFPDRKRQPAILSSGCIYCIYSFPEPRLTRDQLLTQASPLCSPAKAYFVHLLPHCSPCSLAARSCSPPCSLHAPSLLSRCSLVAPPQPLPILLPFAPTVEFLQV